MSKPKVTVGKITRAIKIYSETGVVWLDTNEARELIRQLEAALREVSDAEAAELAKAMEVE